MVGSISKQASQQASHLIFFLLQLILVALTDCIKVVGVLNESTR